MQSKLPNELLFLLIQDGVISVKDIDLVMSEGLGMRYAFIGPIETMHLNAPEGKLPINPWNLFFKWHNETFVINHWEVFVFIMHGKNIAVVLGAAEKQSVKSCCCYQWSTSHDFNKCVCVSERVGESNWNKLKIV